MGEKVAVDNDGQKTVGSIKELVELKVKELEEKNQEIEGLKAALNINNPLAGLGLGGGGVALPRGPPARGAAGPPGARAPGRGPATGGPGARAPGRGPPAGPGGRGPSGRGPPAPPGGRGPPAPTGRGAPAGRGAPGARGPAARARGKPAEVQPTKKPIKLNKKVKAFVWKRIINDPKDKETKPMVWKHI